MPHGIYYLGDEFMWSSSGTGNWHEQVCSVFHFVWAKHDSPIEIPDTSIEMYIDSVMRVCHDRLWRKGFKNGQMPMM